jgi:YihY family inner membrane protein
VRAIERVSGAADKFQRSRPVLAFPVAVWKKFNDDQAGNLAALIAYFGFAALFPLLLVLVTVLNIVLRNNPSLRAALLNSALAQYPVIGEQIRANLGTIPGSGLPLIIGGVFLLLGARGVAGAMQHAMCEVWAIPKAARPGFPWQQLWSLVLVFAVGAGFIVTTFLSGVAGGAGHLLSGTGATIGAVVVSLVLNVGVFWLGFRMATAFLIPWRSLWVGSVIAAVCWQALQYFGGYLIGHQLQRASTEYGTFGVVLGLLAWLYLQAEVTLYAAEVDTVLARRLWPRSLLSPAETAAAAGKPGQEELVPGEAFATSVPDRVAGPDRVPQSPQARDLDRARELDRALPPDQQPVPPQRAAAPPREASDKKAGKSP